MSPGSENPSDAAIFYPPNAVTLPASPGVEPLPPCATCGEDLCGHLREFPADPEGAPRVAIDVPADGVERSIFLNG
jgi:hypothetical protein